MENINIGGTIKDPRKLSMARRISIVGTEIQQTTILERSWTWIVAHHSWYHLSNYRQLNSIACSSLQVHLVRLCFMGIALVHEIAHLRMEKFGLNTRFHILRSALSFPLYACVDMEVLDFGWVSASWTVRELRAPLRWDRRVVDPRPQ